MIKLLITGATGFLGINILRYLKRDSDIEIHILTRDKLKSADLIDIEQANIITYDEIMNFSEYDTILHLAGIAHNSKKVKDPEVYCKVNFELTKYLYENFLESRAGKFIFLSTVAVYGNSHTQVLTESCIPAPATDYSKSKLLAEEFIIAKEVPLKKSYYILRSALVFGPGNKGNFSSLSNFVSKGLPYPLSLIHI
ncbi:MAG TPA: hypothetical protein DIT07_12390 [Sphingobacteriaceae bacterium]|nr:hypothetical protein [Sphingobacteriaceae bacterium]